MGLSKECTIAAFPWANKWPFIGVCPLMLLQKRWAIICLPTAFFRTYIFFYSWGWHQLLIKKICCFLVRWAAFLIVCSPARSRCWGTRNHCFHFDWLMLLGIVCLIRSYIGEFHETKIFFLKLYLIYLFSVCFSLFFLTVKIAIRLANYHFLCFLPFRSDLHTLASYGLRLNPNQAKY